MTWAPHVNVQKGKVPFQLSNGQNRQVYGAKLRRPHTKENVNRGVSAEKPELHSNSKKI